MCKIYHSIAYNSDPITVIYYLAFIILTVLIVIYSVKAFYNQKKKPINIKTRVNYNFHKDYNGKTPVVLDIINDGDETVENLQIEMYIKEIKYYEDTIQFIAAHEIFSYLIGYLETDKLKMQWITGEESDLKNIMNPAFFDIMCDGNSGKWTITLFSDLSIEEQSKPNDV